MTGEISYTFRAVVTLLPTENGGRKTSVSHGYRPNISFNTTRLFCGEIRFDGPTERLAPGQTKEVTLVMLPARFIRKTIVPTNVFRLMEGNKIVGTGIVREVIEVRGNADTLASRRGLRAQQAASST